MTPDARRLSVVSRAALLWTLLAAAGLRFFRLDAQSLWSDEGASVAQALRDAPAIVANAAADIHPPFYYLALSGWVQWAGTSEFAVRAFSAVLGIVLVALCWLLGKRFGGTRTGLVAAFVAALNPFQLYYAQEARMYMLAAVLGAVCVLATLRIAAPVSTALALYAGAAVLGLYTHYTFPVVLAVCNLIWLGQWLGSRPPRPNPARSLLLWLGAQVLVAVVYLPWLPTALRQATGWSPGSLTFEAADAPLVVWRVLTLGPAAARDDLLAPGLFLLLVLAGAWRMRRRSAALLLYLLAPIALMLGLGLFKDAFLKFMLVASPPFVALAAAGLTYIARGIGRVRRIPELPVAGTLLLIASLPLGQALNAYYFDPRVARDDYRAITAAIDALARPGDAVLLNAPGQQEIFHYYYKGNLPIYGLPRQRPAEREATERELAEIASRHERLFAVFWATDESDPQRFVESWLETHVFEADDGWYGNVRLAWFAPARGAMAFRPDGAEWGGRIKLQAVGRSSERVAAGEVVPLALVWTAQTPLEARYKVFVHLLDPRGFVVAQRDTEPLGGSRPTTTWEPGETITETVGLYVPPGAPPLEYQIEVGWYGLNDGKRLATADGADHYRLAPLTVAAGAPPRVVPGMVPVQFGTLANGLTLIGYRLDRVGAEGQRHPVFAPGDGVHLTLFWRKPAGWSGDGAYTIQVGTQSQRTTPTDGLYPPARWNPEETVRDDRVIVLAEEMPARRYAITVDGRVLTTFEVGARSR